MEGRKIKDKRTTLSLFMAIVAWSSGAARSAGSPLVKAEFRVKEKLSLRSEAKRSPPSMAPLARIACFQEVNRGA